MSDISESARVSVVLADYANADAINKVNILGAGWQVTGLQQTGLVNSQTLVVLVDVPPQHAGEQFAVEVALLDDSGTPVEVPGPTGESQTLRIANIITAETPVFPGAQVPKNIVWSHSQMVINFPGGIPLQPGRLYTWQVTLDLDANPSCATSFFVAGPPPGPVIG